MDPTIYRDRLQGGLRRAATSAIGTYAAYVLHGLRHPDLIRSDEGAYARRRLPGDDLVADPHWCTTFATTLLTPNCHAIVANRLLGSS